MCKWSVVRRAGQFRNAGVSFCEARAKTNLSLRAFSIGIGRSNRLGTLSLGCRCNRHVLVGATVHFHDALETSDLKKSRVFFLLFKFVQAAPGTNSATCTPSCSGGFLSGCLAFAFCLCFVLFLFSALEKFHF